MLTLGRTELCIFILRTLYIPVEEIIAAGLLNVFRTDRLAGCVIRSDSTLILSSKGGGRVTLSPEHRCAQGEDATACHIESGLDT